MRVPKSEIIKLREIDLLSYFSTYYPDELIKNGRNDYRTRTHSSLHLSNGKWYWWSRGIGGKSALDYLIYVEEYSFKDAVSHLRKLLKDKPVNVVAQNKTKNRRFNLNVDPHSKENLIHYLNEERHIDKDIINYCIENEMLYESSDHEYVVFVGRDEFGSPKFATKRSMISSEKREVFGSNKSYSFNIPCWYSDALHVFESAIDLLSFITIQKLDGKKYLNENYLSLSGVSGEAYPALQYFLLKHPQIKMIYLHLDNDDAGKHTTKLITDFYKRRYYIFDRTSVKWKDVNEELEMMLLEKVCS